MNNTEIASKMVNDQDFKLDVIKNMETYGGSFVKALAKCFLVADSNNLRKLAWSFVNYIDEYLPSKWEGKNG